MRPDRPSATAEMVCSWRAVEGLLPAEARLVHDPYARGFLGPVRARLLDAVERLPPRARIALWRGADRLLRGIVSFVLARHRAMDEALCAQEGLRQVVLLGAGYDSRSVRLEPFLRGARLFEVDHPATAARKASLAPRVFGDAPRAEVVSVRVDFARESLEERLLAAGLRPGERTFWIGEGVSMYLPEESVAATLDLVARLSAPGAHLLFDAWCPPAGGLAGRIVRRLPALALRLVASEPFDWAPAPSALASFVAAHGLALREVLSGEELLLRYGGARLARRARGVLGAGGLRLCVAEVAGAA